MEIVFCKNIRINLNNISNLPEPTLPHKAANKLYVDTKARKILHGYIPSLTASLNYEPNDKFRFVATASSYLNSLHLPANAFNDLYTSARRKGAGGKWATNGETRDFWLQIRCPDPVVLWRIALRGRDTNTQRIYRWRLKGSTDGETYITLLEPDNPTYIGNEVQYFLVEAQNVFNIFTLYCIEAEGANPGLSFMQLYVYSE